MGASLLAMAVCQAMGFLLMYISIPSVTAAYGSALTAGYLEKRNAARPSLLAMGVNDDAGCLDKRGVWAFFASKLAPTGDWVYTV